MKIVCDNCATKYSIADEKVRGKVFKIRCKKCSHIIVVRGNEGDAPADAGEQSYGEDQATVAAGPSAPATGGSADSVWHLVIDREQVGPMTPAEVRAKVAAGQADAETYAWREGFGDWLRLASIDEFKDLAGGAAAPAARAIHDASTELGGNAGSGDGATRRSDPADVFGSQQSQEEDDGGAANLFGGAKAPAPASASFAAAASSSGGDDLFSGAATAASPGPGLFGAPAAEPRPRASASPFGGGGGGGSASIGDNGGGSAVEAKMTGQRNENSVLFSLNNLQALATSGGGSKSEAPAARPGYASSKNEGSGLIDIRAMAAQTLSAAPSSGGNDSADIPAFSSAPVFSPVVAAPILMPTPSSGMPKWVWGVLGGGVLAVGAIVVLLVVVLRKPVDTQPTQALLAQLNEMNKQNNAGLAANGLAAVKTPDAPPPKSDAPAATGDKAAVEKPVAADKEEKKGHGTKVASAGKHASAGKKDDSSPPPVAAPSAPAAEKPSKKKAGGDDLDALLDGAAPSSPKARPARNDPPPAADDPNLPDQLQRGDIVAGMGGIKGKVDSCAQQYHVPGTAMVQVTIGKNGRVSSATVGGALSGTPSGDCVARAVKSASFKKFKGSPMSIAYPFILRP